jgi:lipopolysaccharide/colanic/teichoic acid biosynthesis glycosyltransferase
MVALALLVKLDSRGPALYAQKRVGWNLRRRPRRRASDRRVLIARQTPSDRRHTIDSRRREPGFGKAFQVLKFRSMRTDAEKNGAMWCQKDDPRVTRLGRLLRRSHLDELPQLFNVLEGDMSLVGPRPERPEFVSVLREKMPAYEKRLLVKPGVTGLAQIRYPADLVMEDVRRKMRYDLLYMRKASLATDLKIILGTIPSVLGVAPQR